MASDLSVPRVGAPAAAVEPGRVRGADQGPRAAVPLPAGSGGADVGKPMPNPTLRLDPGLALVVIEFRDGDGKVRETIPTEAQLEAYRTSQRSSTAPVPPPGQAGPDGTRPVDGRRPEPGQAPGAAPGIGDPRGMTVPEARAPAAVQPRGPGDSAVPGLPVKASETGTA